MMKKRGFTLAEVLITLGIVGVVAALTAPALVLTSRNQANAAKLAVAVSNLENAFSAAIASEGTTDLFGTRMWSGVSKRSRKKNDSGQEVQQDFTGLFGNSPLEQIIAFQGELGRYLNISVTQAPYEQGNTSPTSAFYGGNNIHQMNDNGATDTTTGYGWFPGQGDTFPVVMKGGAVAHMRLYGKNNTVDENARRANGTNYIYNAADLFIDVNGVEPPNTYGRDIFSFQMSEKGVLYPHGGIDVAITDYGDSATDLDNANIWSNEGQQLSCIDGDFGSDGTRGLGCTARLVEENYRMNY